MIVNILKNDYVELNSFGVEKDYQGSYIEYEDSTVTLLYFYYPHYLRVYAVNGLQKKDNLVQINEKINIICYFDKKKARRLKKLILDVFPKNNDIYYFHSLFFRELYVLLERKHYINCCTDLYYKYKKDC